MSAADLDLHAPRLDQHRLLGWDGMAALVDPAGAIEWWCHPRLDDDPSLWRLLDPDGAVALWSGAVARRTGDRTVGPSLRTVVEVGGREVACWDALLRHEGHPFIARLVRAATGPVPVTHHLDATPMRGTSTAVHLRALHGVEERHGPVTTATLEAVTDEWRAVLLGSPAAIDAPWTVDTIVEQIEQAEAHAAAWDTPTSVITIHRERVVVALGVLDACTAAGTGAVIASPTTSLPEVRGADRQFDYRYAWLRDAALAASIAALVGEVRVAAPTRRLARRPMRGLRGHPGPDVGRRRRGDPRRDRAARRWRGGPPPGRCGSATRPGTSSSSTAPATWPRRCGSPSPPAGAATGPGSGWSPTWPTPSAPTGSGPAPGSGSCASRRTCRAPTWVDGCSSTGRCA